MVRRRGFMYVGLLLVVEGVRSWALEPSLGPALEVPGASVT